jgi:NitT/TauT family transport system permease protein
MVRGGGERRWRDGLLIIGTVAGLIAAWQALATASAASRAVVPLPLEALRALFQEARNGRLFADTVASVFRVCTGFTLAVAMAVPLGLWLGHRRTARVAFTPLINFFRSISPLAWIPFAILWFGIGDVPAVFLIWMASFFPMLLATVAAVANIPSIYFRVADDYQLRGAELLLKVTLPAIAPSLITGLRLAAGLSWMVVVAAEMIAGRDGLGFAIWDARNGVRMDVLTVNMVVIGVIGVAIDRFLRGMTRFASIRWAYDR